jgi:hypothetical protein
VVALDEQVGRQPAPPEEPGVSREQEAPLVPGSADEVLVLAAEILGVMTQDTQPCRQSAEHCVGK